MTLGAGEMERVGRFQTKMCSQARGVFKDLFCHRQVGEAGKGRAVGPHNGCISMSEWPDEAFESDHGRDGEARPSFRRHARAHAAAPSWIVLNKVNDEAGIEIDQSQDARSSAR